jgi:predicted nucleotidyltransferase
MAIENNLDTILDSRAKIKIIRLFVSHTGDFRSSGRAIARLIKVSPPSAHLALKELNSQKILNLEIIGKQHVYSLNTKNRSVRDILAPVFTKELSVKEDIKSFLVGKIKDSKIARKIISLVLYGSLQRNQAGKGSDVDIAVIVKNKRDTQDIEERFIKDIAVQFSEYFGVHLDAYVKSRNEFLKRMKRRLPPVSTLIKSYSVIFGKDPLELL